MTLTVDLAISHDRLCKMLRYEPETGNFVWLVNRKGPVRAGRIAGCPSKGTIVIRIDGILYQAHRLAWFYMTSEWPEVEIDHKNRNSFDNVWTNLRPANSTEQKHNTSLRSDNTSGYKGVHFQHGKWKAVIWVNKRAIQLGSFMDKEAAASAYALGAEKYFGEFANAARAA